MTERVGVHGESVARCKRNRRGYPPPQSVDDEPAISAVTSPPPEGGGERGHPERHHVPRTGGVGCGGERTPFAIRRKVERPRHECRHGIVGGIDNADSRRQRGVDLLRHDITCAANATPAEAARTRVISCAFMGFSFSLVYLVVVYFADPVEDGWANHDLTAFQSNGGSPWRKWFSYGSPSMVAAIFTSPRPLNGTLPSATLPFGGM